MLRMQRKLLSFTVICVADAAVAVTASGACDEVGVSSVAAQPRRLSVLKVAVNTEANKGEAIFMVLFSRGKGQVASEAPVWRRVITRA
jgi:hypothetical protein